MEKLRLLLPLRLVNEGTRSLIFLCYSPDPNTPRYSFAKANVNSVPFVPYPAPLDEVRTFQVGTGKCTFGPSYLFEFSSGYYFLCDENFDNLISFNRLGPVIEKCQNILGKEKAEDTDKTSVLVSTTPLSPYGPRFSIVNCPPNYQEEIFAYPPLPTQRQSQPISRVKELTEFLVTAYRNILEDLHLDFQFLAANASTLLKHLQILDSRVPTEYIQELEGNLRDINLLGEKSSPPSPCWYLGLPHYYSDALVRNLWSHIAAWLPKSNPANLENTPPTMAVKTVEKLPNREHLTALAKTTSAFAFCPFSYVELEDLPEERKFIEEYLSDLKGLNLEFLRRYHVVYLSDGPVGNHPDALNYHFGAENPPLIGYPKVIESPKDLKLIPLLPGSTMPPGYYSHPAVLYFGEVWGLTMSIGKRRTLVSDWPIFFANDRQIEEAFSVYRKDVYQRFLEVCKHREPLIFICHHKWCERDHLPSAYGKGGGIHLYQPLAKATGLRTWIMTSLVQQLKGVAGVLDLGASQIMPTYKGSGLPIQEEAPKQIVDEVNDQDAVPKWIEAPGPVASGPGSPHLTTWAPIQVDMVSTISSPTGQVTYNPAVVNKVPPENQAESKNYGPPLVGDALNESQKTILAQKILESMKEALTTGPHGSEASDPPADEDAKLNFLVEDIFGEPPF